MRTILNFGLTLVLAALFILPVAFGHLIIEQPLESGVVAGVQTVTQDDVSIIPEIQKFDQYVSFSPQPIQNGRYRDVLGLTVFQRQKAIYRSVYSVYNTSSERTLRVSIVTTGVDQSNFEKLIITLSKESGTQVLVKDRPRGSTLLEVPKPIQFTEDELVLVGDELTRVVAISTDGLVVTPLRSDHFQGEEVYSSPILISTGELLNPATHRVTLSPGERATVDAVVWGTADLLQQDQWVEVPLEFRVDVVE